MKATIYIVLSKEYDGSINIERITFDYKEAMKVAKSNVKFFISEAYDPKEFSLKECYDSLKECNEVDISDEGEVKILEEEIEIPESIFKAYKKQGGNL